MDVTYCSLNVRSLERSVRFYSALFDTPPSTHSSSDSALFAIGRSHLALRLAPPDQDPLLPTEIGLQTEEPMEALVARLAKRSESDRPKPTREKSFLAPLLPSGAISRRFRDPDGNLVEVFNDHGHL